MKKNQRTSADAAELRRRAEVRLKEKTPEAGLPRAEADLRRLLHELQVHQIELKLQNEELLQAKEEIKAGLERYTHLYDSAPVGYFTLAGDGAIRQVNLTGAGLLGIMRRRLLSRQFGLFVSDEARPAFNSFLGRVFETRAKASCEVALVNQGNQPLLVRIEATPSEDGQECRAAVMDITERRQAEEERERMLLRQQGVSQLRQALLAPAALKDKLSSISDSIVRLFDADFCRIWLIRPGDLCDRGCVHAEVNEGPHACRNRERCLHLVASSGRYTHLDDKDHRRVPFDCYRIGRIATSKDHKFLTNDVQKDPKVHNHEWARELGLVSFAGYKLQIPGGDNLGVLGLFAKHPILPDDDAMLDGLGSAVAVVAQQAIAEEALRNAEAKYNRLFETSADGVLIADVETRAFGYANPALCRMFGYSEEELRMMGVGDIHPKEALQDVIAKFDAQARGDVNVAPDMPCLRKDGTIFFVDINVVKTIIDGKLCNLGIFRDITERKRAEEKIAHLNRILRAVRNINQLIILEKNPERLIQEACNLLVEHRGYIGAMVILTDEASAPRTLAEAGFGEAFRPLAERLKQGILPPCCEEARLQEGVYPVTDRARVCAHCPIADDCAQNETMCIQLLHGGKMYGYLAVSMDRPLGIDAEEHSLLAEMAGDVAFALHNIEQQETIWRAQGEQERIEAELRQAQKMEAVGRLAGGVAHDFNNMLTVILGYADTAMSRLDSRDPLCINLLEIKKAGQRSADLTRQLLAFSRKQIVEPRVIHLNEEVADQKKMLGRMIGEDIKICFTPAEDLWPIHMDPAQVNQILANLAVNSRDAISGTGTIIIETANVVLDEAYRRRRVHVSAGDYVMLAFSDTGAGMSPDTLEHIFEPFFTTKGEGKGTGLGLSTVYGIVKQNGGYIHAYSEPGMGTTFKIYIPRFQGEAGRSAEKPKEAAPRTGTETVLIVEDEKQLLNLGRQILERYGYTVLTATTPDDAYLLVERHTGDIHLLLTDVVMPGMNGKELQGRLEQIRPGIKTLFMSGYTANVIAHRTIIEQGVAFIQKPFSAESLARKVRETLDS